MFNSKYNTVLTVLLIIAIVAIIGILGYLGYSIYNRYYINAGAREVVDAFENAIAKDTNTINQPQSDDNSIIDNNNMTIGDVSEGNTIYSGSSKGNGSGKVTYNGYNVVGTISIPSINIEYPILEKVTTKSLKVAVAYLYGPGINEVGNTVIQGHNYRNGTFFSNIDKLANGNNIFITDTSGNRVKYEVYRNFTAGATDGTFYKRDTQGKREITLSTCTEDSAVRTIIFAKEV